MLRLCHTVLCLVIVMSACRHAPTARPTADLTLTVRTAADTAPQFITVTLLDDNRSATMPLTRSAAGTFTATLPAGTERVALDLSIPEHVPLRTKLWLPTTGQAEFTIRPRALIPRKTIAALRVIGDFNRFEADSAVPLVPDASGRLRAAIPFTGDSSRFHILGYGGGSRGAWIPVPSYATTPNPYGPPIYAGVIRPVRDTLVIDVDTTQSRALPPAASISMQTRDTLALVANRLLLERHDAMSSNDAVSWWQDSGSTSLRQRAALHAKAMIDSTRDPRVRGEALVSSLRLPPKTLDSLRTYGAILLRDFPPGSTITRDADGMDVVNDAIMQPLTDSTMPEAERIRVRKLVVQQVRDYLLPVARSAGDTSVRINGWLGAAYTLQAAGDTTLLYAMIDEAERALPGNEFIIKLSPGMGRGKIMRAGATFPTFRMAAIGGGAELTNAVFAQSRYTLVDFWGVWCAPCVWEMPVLHKAYERFSAKGFNIVSLSNDPSLRTVEKFRADKWKMPWVNGWMGPQDRSEPALTALGVMMFPLAVLVDSTGRIVAVSDGLRGAALERTLEKLLP